jgi:type IV fimbrial biogenesis protein FimT
MNANRLSSASNELMASLQTARMEAVKRNGRVVLCLSDDANNATPSCAGSGVAANGWIVFADANSNGTYQSAGDTLLRRGTTSSNVEIRSSDNPANKVARSAVAGAIVFRSDGFAYTKANALLNGTIDVCIKTRRPPENVRHVIVSAGSRTSIATAKGAGNCIAPDDEPDET